MQPKQIHELLDNFSKRPIEAVELVKKMFVSNDESTFSVWVENEKSNKFDSACDVTWPTNNLEIRRPNWPRLTIFCNSCGIINSAPLCLSCFMRSNSNKANSAKANSNENKENNIKSKPNIFFEDLKLEPHLNHDAYFKYIRAGHCSCGDANSMNPSFFCSYHSLQPTNPPNVEIFGSDHCDFITDLTDICFRSLILHAPHSTRNVECIVNFLLDLASINSSYLHLIAAALSENFDSSALFTQWPQFLTKNAVSIVKLIETLSVDDSFQYAFATSFYDNYIYLVSYDLSIIESINPSPIPTSVIPLIAAADVAWTYFISHEEMIEDFSIAELIGKEFYVLSSFIRNDPFHPIISHSLIRNFFNTMNIFFSSSHKFFKALSSPDSISKITDIYIDAMSLETFPIVTKKYNFYDFDKFLQNSKFIYGCGDNDFSLESILDSHKGNNLNNNETPKKTLFSSSDDLYSFFNNEENFECDDDNDKKNDKYSLDKHLILRNFDGKVDPRYQFMRCALKFKKNLFCAIENLTELFQSPEAFIMPLLCGMVKTFFSTMTPDQFAFQNDFLKLISKRVPSENNNNNNNNNNNSGVSKIDSELSKPNSSSSQTTKISSKKKSNQTDEGAAIINKDKNYITVEDLIKLQLNSNGLHKKHLSKSKNIIDGINFTRYYESKEPFYFRSVLDDLSIVTCSAPCHSITFRKLCKYSTNGIEDWRKAIKEANVFEIMYLNSNFLRSAYNSLQDLEDEVDHGIKFYLEDISLLAITIIPIRICALSSLLSLGVVKVNNKLLKQQMIKQKNNFSNIPYDNFLRSIFQKSANDEIADIDLLGDLNKSKKNKKNNSNNNDNYDDDYGDDNDDSNNDDSNEDVLSNDFYYNLFLKYADFRYDLIGSFAGSICGLSFASNIGYLSLVTYCVFDLKNGITSRKLFAYLNFLICCISDRAVYAKDDEKLCWLFIKNLLSKRGKMSGREILNECDSFFTKKDTNSINKVNHDEKDGYYVYDSNGVDDLLIDDNDFEDLFIEHRMEGKLINELDTFELLSGKSHSFCKRIKDRFSRPIINRVLSKLAEPIHRFGAALKARNFDQIVFKLRDEFNNFIPSIFNTAQEAFDQWSSFIESHPIDAFLRVSFDDEYKPDGFSPLSVLLTSEFNSILFVSVFEAANSMNFDKETIQILFAILNCISQLSFYLDKDVNKGEVKCVVAKDLNDLIGKVPSSFSQFQKTKIKFKNSKETTFNELLLKFGEIGELFLKNSNVKAADQKRIEKVDKSKIQQIKDLFKKKQLDYLYPFVEKFEMRHVFGNEKNDKSVNFLITIPVLIFDGYSGRQIWASTSSIDHLKNICTMNDQIRLNEGQLIFDCGTVQRKNAWIPVNLDPSFESLKILAEDDKKSNLFDLSLKQFGFFDPEKNLFNVIQNTVESVELRLRSYPFAMDDARASILLGNSFRILWFFVQKKLKVRDQKSSEKVEIVINRTFNYRNNDLWNGSSMSDSTVLTPLTSRLTFLLVLLLVSEKPSDSFSELLNVAFRLTYKGEKNDRLIVEFNGIKFVIENYFEQTNLKFIPPVDDEYANLVFLRCSFVVAYCCLWMTFKDPKSLCEASIPDLYSILLNNPLKNNINNNNDEGLDKFSFVDLPNNFLGFSEFPFAAKIMNNNILSANIDEFQNQNPKKSSFFSNPGSEYNLIKNAEINSNNFGGSDSDETNDIHIIISSVASMNESNSNCILVKNNMFLSSKRMELVKSSFLSHLKERKERRKIKFCACNEAVDLINGNVDDFDSLCNKSDSNCSVLISLSGKDTGLCYAYNKSLNVVNQHVEPIYITLFGEIGINSGELLYLKKDRVLKLQDSFLSGELFL